ncbi:hypothetical protein COU12_01440 [Candidatus Jorgensenbacteria bacterium CG10_big_fil_rev_8_21_14_0_10_54_38]|uniref:Uncharacterized protein n=2 Tax=Candidatus Joergenseniibacteriota TaxID=1752739 RepID=A0A2M6WG45_9BACT|nr:MAG: hypothetical protein COX26_00840 [Candidatus Jorgensenbacteria bacterium CG23_combo_of_CG06-09_8_20_14_all_54_14]PIT91737.1 MAG: hypothetical protein COU12_01440 [Candidatus Jorgensenbacteria bacterium CG10_big_fil_rev_8_21_14_0_10_54_38]
MKRSLIFSLAIAIVITVLLTGCGVVKAVFSEGSNQGVVVVNTMPGTRLYVVSQAVYGRVTFGNGIVAGTQCFVPAALYPQSQTIVVTVHAYDLKGKYIGSRSHQFGFSYPQGGNYQNQQWDVQRWDLARN